MNVLICEDNAVIAMDLWWMLQELGHTVFGTVATARECLETAARTRPDLVLVDLTLRDGMTGLDLVEALARIDIATIIISGEARLVPPTTSARAVMEKPFDEDLVALAIAKVKRAA